MDENSLASSVHRWELAADFAANLFEELGYKVTREVLVAGLRIDLIVERDGLKHPVEVKYYRSSFGMRQVVEEAARLHQVTLQQFDMTNPILFIIGSLTVQARSWSDSNFDIRIWDNQELRSRTANYPELRKQLENLISSINEELPLKENTFREQRKAAASDLIAQLIAHENTNDLSPTQYENLCREVFSFLFDPFLFGFSNQHRTTDGANRFDFVCRIKAGNEFWDSIQRDFRTRVILFECKNYDDKITADQIYSTERYLFTQALRTVAFLISRKGADDGCFRAAQGAMRESGKLIILLSNSELIEMLGLDETIDGATSYLDQHIWKFVTGLPR